eukprot:1536064-Rhodomonas_salina.1
MPEQKVQTPEKMHHTPTPLKKGSFLITVAVAPVRPHETLCHQSWVFLLASRSMRAYLHARIAEVQESC